MAERRPPSRRPEDAADVGEPLRRRVAGREVDLVDLLRRLVDAAAEALDAERGTLYLVDHACHELVSRVAHLPEIAEVRVRWGEGVAGLAAAEDRVVRAAPGSASARVDAETGFRSRSLLAAPVHDRGVVGVIQVINRRSGEFRAEDERAIVETAEAIAEVLRGTSLPSQLRPDARYPLAFQYNGLVGASRGMRQVYERVARVAPTTAGVLLVGETGTGKERIARAVHFSSPRADRPFVKVDLAALPAGLVENELFGHVRGAFTGADRDAVGKIAAADGGTLFLDEVGELPLVAQARLLRVLQDRAYHPVGSSREVRADVRVVAATHRDLPGMVAAGTFREDLYYRLKVVEITVPPLRERGVGDLDRLVDHFLYEMNRRHGRSVGFTPAARALLHAHPWPGNVRELENLVEAAVVLADGVVDVGDLPLSPAAAAPAGATLAEMERAYCRQVLAACGGNVSEAARVLDISRARVRRLVEAGQSSMESGVVPPRN